MYIGIFILAILLCMPWLGIRFFSDKAVVLEKDETIILKAMAILIVLISHYYRYTNHIGLEKLLVSSGYLGASLFCVLSAYGCTKSFLNNGFGKGYFCGKIRHVYIPFILVNFITLSLNHGTYSVLEYLTYILGLKLVNGIYWFVPFILVFYLLFWLVYSYIKTTKKRVQIILLISVIYIFLCILGKVDEQWYSSALCIVLGCYIAENEKKVCRMAVKSIFLVSMIHFLLFSIFVTINLCFRNIEIIKSISACLSAAAFCGSIMTIVSKLRLTRNRLYMWIGLSSYWIYLIHFNILNTFFIKTSHIWSVLFVVSSILVGSSINFAIIKLQQNSNKRKCK